jgi:hypothetical protein
MLPLAAQARELVANNRKTLGVRILIWNHLFEQGTPPSVSQSIAKLAGFQPSNRETHIFHDKLQFATKLSGRTA